MRCRSCGAEMPGNDEFCAYCGVRRQRSGETAGPGAETQGGLTPAPCCGACGTENETDARFCIACGALLSAETVTGAIPRDEQQATVAMSPPASGVPGPPPSGVPHVAPRPPSRRVPLWVWAVVAVLLTVVAGVAITFVVIRMTSRQAVPARPSSHGVADTSPTPTATAATSVPADLAMKGFLGQVATLITQAGDGRQGIATATAGYASHDMPSSEAASVIQGVVDNRENVLSQLNSLAVPGSGAARGCVAAFKKAMRFSISADRHYLEWVKGNAGIKSADSANVRAGHWKAVFVKLYNRLARSSGLRHDWAAQDM
jgi:hypothetical protein